MIKSFEKEFKEITDEIKFFKELRESGFKNLLWHFYLCAHKTKEKYERNELDHPVFQ